MSFITFIEKKKMQEKIIEYVLSISFFYILFEFAV